MCAMAPRARPLLSVTSVDVYLVTLLLFVVALEGSQRDGPAGALRSDVAGELAGQQERRSVV